MKLRIGTAAEWWRDCQRAWWIARTHAFRCPGCDRMVPRGELRVQGDRVFCPHCDAVILAPHGEPTGHVGEAPPPRSDAEGQEKGGVLAALGFLPAAIAGVLPDGKWMKTTSNRPATLPPAWIRPGQHRVEVELVDRAGNVSGPYMLAFDPEDEVLRWAKHDLRQTAYSWIELDDREYLTRYQLIFSDLLDLRDVLREIRYSLADSIRVPKTVSSVCIQLVYLDGEITEPRRIRKL